MRETPRLRRLRSDARGLAEIQSNSSIFQFEGRGNPPDKYTLTFLGKGLARPKQEKSPIIVKEHQLTVRLGTQYPRQGPELRWITPIFHPNIATNGAVCLGGYTKHWVPSLGLADLCLMLWDMIRYANYDVSSPYNRVAAHWATTQSRTAFPVDSRPLRDLFQREEGTTSKPPTSEPTIIPPQVPPYLGKTPPSETLADSEPPPLPPEFPEDEFLLPPPLPASRSEEPSPRRNPAASSVPQHSPEEGIVFLDEVTSSPEEDIFRIE
ncbi:Ubiquitin--protein ligase [Planctomycetales bacterium 10988]|nr:Ubiquitin--protein ligase [Planctomycetales bacterium 10988]